jgi:hypothetical protein
LGLRRGDLGGRSSDDLGDRRLIASAVEIVVPRAVLIGDLLGLAAEQAEATAVAGVLAHVERFLRLLRIRFGGLRRLDVAGLGLATKQTEAAAALSGLRRGVTSVRRWLRVSGHVRWRLGGRGVRL